MTPDTEFASKTAPGHHFWRVGKLSIFVRFSKYPKVRVHVPKVRSSPRSVPKKHSKDLGIFFQNRHAFSQGREVLFQDKVSLLLRLIEVFMLLRMQDCMAFDSTVCATVSQYPKVPIYTTDFLKSLIKDLGNSQGAMALSGFVGGRGAFKAPQLSSRKSERRTNSSLSTRS